MGYKIIELADCRQIPRTNTINKDELENSGEIYIYGFTKGTSFDESSLLKSELYSELMLHKLRILGNPWIGSNNKKICCKFGIEENVHLYSSSASELNGFRRICHLTDYPIQEKFSIKEYNDKFAKYSSFYKVFLEELDKTSIKGIRNGKTKFNIPYTCIDEFMNAVKNVIEKDENKEYVLTIDDDDTNRYDKITFNADLNDCNEFHKVYWEELP